MTRNALSMLRSARRPSLVKTYWVYVLLCEDGSFYVGVTNDLDRRVGEHEYGIDRHCYTFTRRPVKLVHASDFREVLDAIAWEKRLKKWTHAKKAALAAGDWKGIHRLAACANATAATRYRQSSFDSAQDDTESQSTSLS